MSTRPMVDEDTIRVALKGSDWSDDEVEDIAKTFASICWGQHHVDGYALAKRLDETLGWDIDAYKVEALDDVSFLARREHDRRCWEWVREHNIQPPFPVGTVIKEGTITGVSEHSPATYEVLMPGDEGSTHRRLIRFEDARHG